MTTKKLLACATIIISLLIGGCVATPYYGNSGYYGSSGYISRTIYGTTSPSYSSNFGYSYRQPIMSGQIHLGNGHRHFIGGHRHHDHRHLGHGHGHRHGHGYSHGGGHRGHRGHR